MTLEALLRLLTECPLVASVQADAGTPLDSPDALSACAQASIGQGVRLLRLQGTKNIETVRNKTGVPVIGLIKRDYPDSEVFITPTPAEVDALLATGCEVIAMDATERTRPNGAKVADLLQQVKAAGRLAMADCDSIESVRSAAGLGFDLVGTTLAGYTSAAKSTSGPDFNLLRAAVESGATVLAEGRYHEPWQFQAALAAGAAGVVVGGALNDPIKQTKRFLESTPNGQGRVVGVDLGGTWLRAGLFDSQGRLTATEKIAAPQTHKARLEFIHSFAVKHKARSVGVSAGGTIDPRSNQVVEAKGFIPDYVGRSFELEGLSVQALNDGLATAWGHACHPAFAGMKVATLALGTGVGAGVVDRGQIVTDRKGNYPRINDAFVSAGLTIEGLLGGLSLGLTPSPGQIAGAIEAADAAVRRLADNFADLIVICGGVGLSPWFREAAADRWPEFSVKYSPYGQEAGLFGAAHLVRNPPQGLKG